MVGLATRSLSHRIWMCEMNDDPIERHHLVFPRRAYQTQLEKDYRNLCCHIRLIRQSLHRELHRTESPSIKPRPELMVATIVTHLRSCDNCRKELWNRPYLRR